MLGMRNLPSLTGGDEELTKNGVLLKNGTQRNVILNNNTLYYSNKTKVGFVGFLAPSKQLTWKYRAGLRKDSLLGW